MPSGTHVFDAHSHGYSHFGTATCGVRRVDGNRVNEQVKAFDTVMDSKVIYYF
jgi:hypothetical protein